MDLLKLIKGRYTVRKYKKRPISKKTIMKIIEAGRWASSVHGFQPWRFVVITNRSLINRISNILLKKSKVIRSSVNMIFSITGNTIANAPVVILIYNQNIFKDVSYKYNRTLKKESKAFSDGEIVRTAELAEVESISAAIQNMILVAHGLQIGSCWNTLPLLCESEINKLLGSNERLIAVLTLGYPDEKSKRSPRKVTDKVVDFRY
ncbi:MAG: nitroreductase family protein [Nitrospirae bacterium]|nr:nitroreductase family protein [Nitrospirota bacterium]